jgi:hypothetical protein
VRAIGKTRPNKASPGAWDARGTGAMIQSMFIISVEVLPLRLPPGTTAFAHPISRQDVVRRAARYMGNQVHGHLTGRTMQLPVSLSPQPTSMWMQTLPKAKHPVKVACGVKATTKSHSVSRRVSTATPGRCALTRFGRGGCAAQSKDVLIEKHWGSITDRSVRNPALPLNHSQPTRQMPSAPGEPKAPCPHAVCNVEVTRCSYSILDKR